MAARARFRSTARAFFSALLVAATVTGWAAARPAGASSGPSVKTLARSAAQAAKVAWADASSAGRSAAAAATALTRARAAISAGTSAAYATSARSAATAAAAASRHANGRAQAAAIAARRALNGAAYLARHDSSRAAARARSWAGRAARSSRSATAARAAAITAAQRAARYATAARAAATAMSQACGGEVPRRADGSAYQCTFDEEFAGPSLDTTKWSVLKTTDYGFHSGPECYVDDGQHAVVSGGALALRLTRETQPADCIVEQTPYLSGMITTFDKFSQTYGRFEIRAKLPPGIGLQPALWLYPQTLTYGPWPNSGEIDIAEAFGLGVPGLLPNLLPDLVWPHLHYQGPLVQEAPGAACDVPGSTTSYHTYAADVTPTAITFLYDDKVCGSFTWHPAAPLTAPSPFDQPFFICLELALGNSDPNLVSDLLTPFPSTLSIDYVRVWK